MMMAYLSSFKLRGSESKKRVLWLSFLSVKDVFNSLYMPSCVFIYWARCGVMAAMTVETVKVKLNSRGISGLGQRN